MMMTINFSLYFFIIHQSIFSSSFIIQIQFLFFILFFIIHHSSFIIQIKFLEVLWD
ncbi:MAG: hypothetical protein NT166_03215 [Candidatus Aminicenantes bacterium]|nr:hypothetical protein [Candidatus Aminicenantes bacterium]